MPAVSSADVRGILAFLDVALAAPTGSKPFLRSTLVALRALIPADAVEYFELCRADRSVVDFTTDRDLEPEPAWLADAMAAIGYQNPLGAFKWRPAHGALRQSSLMSQRALRRTEWYADILRPLRIRDTLKVWLWASSESAACICLERCDSDFADRDQTVLGVLQTHLIALRERSLSESADVSPPDAPLTAREAEVLTWAAYGKTSEEIARALVVTPATVAKHLEHIYDKLGARGRADAVARIRRPLAPS